MTCKQCGTTLDEDMLFCIQCGAKVEPPTPADPPSPPDTPFSSDSPEPSTPPNPSESSKQPKIRRINWLAIILAIALAATCIVAIKVTNDKNYYETQASWYRFDLNKAKEKLSEVEEELSAEQTRSAEYKVYKDFMDDHIRIIPNDGSNLFHRHGCPDLSLKSFWAYNEKAAATKADPCPECCGG